MLVVEVGDVIEATPLVIAEVLQVVGSETVVRTVLGGGGLLLLFGVGDALSLGERVGLDWGGWSGEGSDGFGLVRIHDVVLVVHVAGQEVKEGVLVVSCWSSLTLGNTFPLCGLLIFLDLCHPEEHVEETEGEDDEGDEAVHYLEGKVSLGLEIVLIIE